MLACGRGRRGVVGIVCSRLLSSPAPVSSVVSSQRTGLTAKLWQMRYDKQKYKNGAVEFQTKTVGKSPKDSFLEVDLPVASDAAVRDQYLNFRGGIRFGKLLEDIDAFAGNIAFMHCNDGDPNTKVPVLVTACLDRLDLHHPITLNLGCDYTLQGNVNWTSKSSVQINIKLSAKGDSLDDSVENRLTASMIFVHVQNGKAAPVNQVVPETDKEKEEFAQGEAGNDVRKHDRVNSLTRRAPTTEESEKLHSAMLAGFGETAFALSDTEMQATQLMQPQERNRAGKIFGGFLMHEAYELAYTTAASFASTSSIQKKGSKIVGAPTVIAVDDISFSKPVSIGDVVCFAAQVTYTGSNELLLQDKETSNGYPESISCVFQVRVSTYILDLKTGNKNLSNEFHFTFINRDPDGPKRAMLRCAVVPVEPRTYHEGMLWLDGRRRMIESLEIAKRYKGFAEKALFD